MLNTAQLATLKAAILANQPVLDQYNLGNINQVSGYYNTIDHAYYVWRTWTNADDIFNAINWAALTPTDAPDSTQQWLNRAMACQGKQFNIQTMLGGRYQVYSAKSSIRQGLNDSLTNVPSGVAGATVNAGWGSVKSAMSRNATNGEKLFATGGAGTSGTPADLGYDGNVSDNDVQSAMAL